MGKSKFTSTGIDCKLRAHHVEGAPSTVKHFRIQIRNKSGNTLETLSEQILNFQVSYGWSGLEIAKPWKIKHIPSPD